MIGGQKFQGQMMRRTIFLPVTLLAVGALALGGCSAFENLGGGKKVSPDEFKIVSHSPLTMPPNAELRPPRPGEPRPQETTPADQAKEALSPVMAGRVQQQGPAAGAAGRCLRAVAGRQGGRRRRRSQHPQPGQSRHPHAGRQGQDLHRQPDLLAGQAAAGRHRRSRARSSSACATRRPPASRRPAPTPTIERRKRGLLEGIF